MGGHVKARVGKKILGKCIRIGKGVGITVGGQFLSLAVSVSSIWACVCVLLPSIPVQIFDCD